MKKSTSYSYDNLRMVIGILGIALPLLLIAGNGLVVEKSISFYYYTKMSTVFTGILITFGLILYTYRGDPLHGDIISENALTNWGGVFALLVALVPTRFDGTPPETFYTHDDAVRGWIHNGAAVLFILIMGLVVLLKFSKAKYYQGFYKVFGWLVIIGLAFTIYAFAKGLGNGAVFWGETFSLTCFGIAWIRRGVPK
jgi:hypothetical protein